MVVEVMWVAGVLPATPATAAATASITPAVVPQRPMLLPLERQLRRRRILRCRHEPSIAVAMRQLLLHRRVRRVGAAVKWAAMT
jgi:hypothetical protein